MDLRRTTGLSARTLVPAHTGGVDLRNWKRSHQLIGDVPAHTGGVDLRSGSELLSTPTSCPRPHGRGGFKGNNGQRLSAPRIVPAHTGGVDLRITACLNAPRNSVPAHTGGVDLRSYSAAQFNVVHCPRPHGRGGFKACHRVSSSGQSPVPAHTGGVDLRYSVHRDLSGSFVPVHTSGVDLRPDVGR